MKNTVNKNYFGMLIILVTATNSTAFNVQPFTQMKSHSIRNPTPQKRITMRWPKSQSIPFLDRPTCLDGTMPGDVGFDPLGFAESTDRLRFLREAEIKHSRLAMLAAVGWPASELFDAPLARLIGMEPLVTQRTGMSPSIINGGLGQVSPIFWTAVLSGAAFLEVENFPRVSPTRTIIGDLGFDPAGFYTKLNTDNERRNMELAEIKHGRLAMLAVAGFVTQEALTNTPLFH